MCLVVGSEEAHNVALVGGRQELCLARVFVVAPNVLVVVAVEEGNCVQSVLVVSPAHLHKRHVAGILHLPYELHIQPRSSKFDAISSTVMCAMCTSQEGKVQG